MSIISRSDLSIMAVGAAAWALAIPAVQAAGRGVGSYREASHDRVPYLVVRSGALIVGAGIAAVTPPMLSYLLCWKTSTEKVRGVALALGTAQVLDGLVHLFWPNFYDKDPHTGLACAGNIFYGAGLLGILSALQ